MLKSIILSVLVLLLVGFTISTAADMGLFQNESERTMEMLQICEWGTTGSGVHQRCTEAPCKRYNIDEIECVYEGYTGSGAFGMTDFNTPYYSCKGYGRVAERCVEHWSSYEEVNTYWEAQWNESGEAE